MNILRRFMDGWFSVYLFIFMITLFVRMFLFQPANDTSTQASASVNVKMSVRNLINSSMAHIVNSSDNKASNENQISFGQENELTQN